MTNSSNTCANDNLLCNYIPNNEMWSGRNLLGQNHLKGDEDERSSNKQGDF